MGFESFLGNSRAVEAVRDLLRSGRLPGSLLFAGPDGVGKKTLGLMLAKALNCKQQRDDFCGVCARCRKAEEMIVAAREDLERRRGIKDSARRTEGLTYFDLQLIEPITRNILIEQIRVLRSVAYTRPFEFPQRVFVIDQAQDIHWQAVDLLLKVLEEPPDTTKFILVCPNAYQLRLTIRSRCLRIPFGAAEDEVIRQVLAKTKELSKVQQELGLRVVGGSVAKAMGFDPSAYEARRQPWINFFDSMAGSKAGSSQSANWKLLFDATKSLAANRAEFEETIRIGGTLLRDLLQVVVGRGGDDIVNVDLADKLRAWAPRVGVPGIEKLQRGLDEAYRLQIRNVNQQLGLESLALTVFGGRNNAAI